MAKQANGSGSIRQRNKGFEGRITVGVDANGKQVQKSIYGASKTEVKQKMQKALVDIAEGNYVEPCKMLFSEWLDTWLSSYCLNQKESTLASYVGICSNHIKPALGQVKLKDLNNLKIQAFITTLNEKGLNEKTIRNVYGVLHKALEKAIAARLLIRNPATGCELPKKHNRNMNEKRIKALDETQIAALLQCAKGSSDENVIKIALFTGMRQSEILGLRWEDVHFENSTIEICRQLIKGKYGQRKGTFYLGNLKNGKTRIIPMNDIVKEALLDEKNKQEANRVVMGRQWIVEDGLDGLVFTHTDGKHKCAFTVYKHFKQIAKAAGVPEARFHDLRHTFASQCLALDCASTYVQNMLGHHSPAFTQNTYVHSLPEKEAHDTRVLNDWATKFR